VAWAAQHLVRIISSSGSPQNIARRFDAYRRTAVEAGHSGDAVKAAIDDSWIVKHLYVAEDDDTAIREAKPYFLWYYKLLANRRMFDGPKEPEPFEWWEERGACYFGSPQTVADRIVHWYEQTGMLSMLCWMNTGGMPTDRVLNSMRLFHDRVLPLLRDRGIYSDPRVE
jgi:alkanesulfonate monooxygenase SsuD/methylene tetrahydromethanopterin reductase-like flavin-dependent oxidoreductase (luciferase family)